MNRKLFKEKTGTDLRPMVAGYMKSDPETDDLRAEIMKTAKKRFFCNHTMEECLRKGLFVKLALMATEDISHEVAVLTMFALSENPTTRLATTGSGRTIVEGKYPMVPRWFVMDPVVCRGPIDVKVYNESTMTSTVTDVQSFQEFWDDKDIKDLACLSLIQKRSNALIAPFAKKSGGRITLSMIDDILAMATA